MFGFRQITRSQDTCTHDSLTELRPMQIPVTNIPINNVQPVQSIPIAASAPAQYTLDPNMSTTSTTDLSPIHDYEMQSTLSSYVFGRTIQRLATSCNAS